MDYFELIPLEIIELIISYIKDYSDIYTVTYHLNNFISDDLDKIFKGLLIHSKIYSNYNYIASNISSVYEDILKVIEDDFLYMISILPKHAILYLIFAIYTDNNKYWPSLNIEDLEYIETPRSYFPMILYRAAFNKKTPTLYKEIQQLESFEVDPSIKLSYDYSKYGLNWQTLYRLSLRLNRIVLTSSGGYFHDIYDSLNILNQKNYLQIMKILISNFAYTLKENTGASSLERLLDCALDGFDECVKLFKLLWKKGIYNHQLSNEWIRKDITNKAKRIPELRDIIDNYE